MTKELHQVLTDQTAEVLREMVLRRGFTHQSLADKSGIGKSTITRLLTGQRPVSLKHLQALAMAFDCYPDQIIAAAYKHLPDAADAKTAPKRSKRR